MVTRNELTSRFFEIYKKRGVKNVTIDDLAYELGMSKKTIYDHFTGKDEIVDQVVQYYIEQLKKHIESTINHKENAISQLISVYRSLVENIFEIDQVYFYSLEKYHHESYQKILEFRDNYYYQLIRGIFEKGIVEGYFRADIHVEHLLYSHLNYFTMIWSDKSTPKQLMHFDLKSLCELLLNDIRGMTTPKGYKLLNRKYALEQRDEIEK